jgi:molybdenum cofactor sulfurtransferase
VRERILSELFRLPDARHADWDVIFTSGATAGARLIAEAFPWSSQEEGGSSSGGFFYTKQAHTSLVGIRGAASSAGAPVTALDNEEHALDVLPSNADSNVLFAYPAQCNATGRRISLDLCRRVKRIFPHVCVLVDAAAYLTTAALPLDALPLDEAPDFVVCSFYKIFVNYNLVFFLPPQELLTYIFLDLSQGFPTGLGCVLIKRSAAARLNRPGYFGGGAIDAMTVTDTSWHAPRGSITATSSRSRVSEPIHGRFEHGTLPYLDIIALDHAFDAHARIFGSLDSVSRRVTALTKMAVDAMTSLRHANGRPVCIVHEALGTKSGGGRVDDYGPTIAFTLLRQSGELVGHVELSELAAINNVHIRTGGLCNTGVLSAVVGLSDKDIRANYVRGRVCWDTVEFGGADNEDDSSKRQPTGVARISFGAFSTRGDVTRWIDFLRRFYVSRQVDEDILQSQPVPSSPSEVGFVLDSLVICKQIQSTPIFTSMMRTAYAQTR